MPRRRSPRIVRAPHADRPTDALQAGPGTWVTLRYVVRDEEGEPVEESPADPLSALFGCGQLLPIIEQATEGLSSGDRVTLELDPESAWGDWDPSRVIEVDRTEIPEDARPGDVFEADHAEGAIVLLKVLDVGETAVVIDTNHPLAGQRVTVEIEVCAVRPATEVEVERASRAAVTARSGDIDVSVGRLLRGRSEP